MSVSFVSAVTSVSNQLMLTERSSCSKRWAAIIIQLRYSNISDGCHVSEIYIENITGMSDNLKSLKESGNCLVTGSWKLSLEATKPGLGLVGLGLGLVGLGLGLGYSESRSWPRKVVASLTSSSWFMVKPEGVSNVFLTILTEIVRGQWKNLEVNRHQRGLPSPPPPPTNRALLTSPESVLFAKFCHISHFPELHAATVFVKNCSNL